MRRTIDAHTERPLIPRARVRARSLRRALYPFLPIPELRLEYVRLLGERQLAVGERHYFIGLLLEDLATHIEIRSDLEAA